jgi:hypothetical protein
MDEQEKYRAKIESQMTRFNETIEEITAKAKLRKSTQPDINIESLVKTHEDAKAKLEDAKAKLKDLKKSDKSSWRKFQTELDGLIDDIDTDLRKAIAYFG